MSTLQLQLYDAIGQLSDTKAQLIIDIIKNFTATTEVQSATIKNSKRHIGLFKDKKFLANGYDINENNDEIAKMFGVD